MISMIKVRSEPHHRKEQVISGDHGEHSRIKRLFPVKANHGGSHFSRHRFLTSHIKSAGNKLRYEH